MRTRWSAKNALAWPLGFDTKGVFPPPHQGNHPMTPYHPYHRAVLLEAGYALDHLLWSYRSELDRTPTFAMSADDICANDFATRTSSLLRSLLDEDGRRRGPKLQFKPPSPGDHAFRLRAAIEARRKMLAASSKKNEPVTESPQPTTPEDEFEPTNHQPHDDLDEPERESVRSRRRPR
ncbi:MAG: hypothetical protein ABIQ70_06740 [Dokdonella sp.]